MTIAVDLGHKATKQTKWTYTTERSSNTVNNPWHNVLSAYKSMCPYYSSAVAQLVEHKTRDQRVASKRLTRVTVLCP